MRPSFEQWLSKIRLSWASSEIRGELSIRDGKLESEVRDAWAEQIHTSPQIFNLLKSHQR